MTALRIAVCLLSLLAVSGFSAPGPADACAHVASTYEAFNQKTQSCLAHSQPAAFDVAACQASTKGCTSADRATLDQFLRCVDALPSCGDETEFRAQFDACAAGARLSEGCSL